MKNKFVSTIIAVFCIAFACLADIVISPTSIDYAVGGGGAAIKTSGTGSWTATTDVAWITIVKPSGNAGVSCTYLVSKNNGADTRTGHITIAGNVYTVTQKGCPVTLTPSNINVGKNGTSGVITASMDAGVDWTAEVSDSWITATPNSGSGAAEISYTVEAYNEVGSRIGSIRIGSEKFMINQTGIDVTLSPAVTNITKDVCVVPLQVVAMQNTNWEVVPNVTWISVMDAGNGYGGSQVTLAVAENPSFEKRTGTVSIGSAVFTVIQSGTDDVNFKILPEVATASPKGAFANVAVYATPDASWTAESLDRWIKIASGDAGQGNGNVKYVTMSNPELEPRTGKIKFTPPVYTPELDLYSGLLFWIKDQNNIEGNELRQTTYALSKVFDGSFSNPLTGAAIPFYDSQAYAFSFSFKIGELDCINRIMKIGNDTIYISADNKLYYEENETSLKIDRTDVFYTIVVNVDESHNLKLYAGIENTELSCVWDGAISGYLQFPLEMNKFVLGYGTKPSAGYLRSGQFANIRFWTRSLTNRECECIDTKQQVMLETKLAGIPDGVEYDFFPLGGNMFGADETVVDSHAKTYQMNAFNWTASEGRNRLSERALYSQDGSGGIIIDDFGGLFHYSSIITNGFISINEHDYSKPMEVNGNNDVSIVMWIKIDSLPDTGDYVPLFSRQMSKYPVKVDITEWTRFYPNWSALLNNCVGSENNFYFGVSINKQGRMKIQQVSAICKECDMGDGFPEPTYYKGVDWEKIGDLEDGYYFDKGNSVEDILSVNNFKANQWCMLTFVARSKSSVTIYLNDMEIGNVSTKMSFGYLPPVALCYRRQEYNNVVSLYAHHKYSFSLGGWNGSLDEFGLYQKAFSSKEVKAIYEAGLPVQDVYHIVNQSIQEPTITPSVINVGKFGCSTNIDFEVARAINWTIQPNDPWLNVVGATSGTGPATITIKVAANTECSPRTGTVTIGNKTLTINQEALNCVVEAEKTVFPTEADETGGMGFITVSPEGNGSWTATSDVDWIYCFPESGTGSSDVYFFVEDMGSTAASRSGTITIGGQTIEITQRGYDLSIEPCVAEVGGNAGAGVIGVAADADAVWTAIADVPWITIVSAANGYVRYTFTDNTTGETRVGHINISGEEYTLTQTCKLDLNTTIVGQGTVTGGGKYAQGAVVTLRATPASGYEFSHWSGDMVGTEANGTVRMDTAKNVTATFIPEAAAQVLAEKKAAQGGFYTRDQIHALEVGNLVLDVDSASGTARVGVQLMETSDLSNPNSWKPVNMTQGNLDVGNDGTVGLNVKASGNAKFFKVVVPEK